jgi:ABC-2 type transport system permease protein
MRPILRLAVNDLRLTLKDRAAAFWMLLFPVIMMWIFGNLGGGSSTAGRISLTVDDRDGEWLARAIVSELEDEQIRLTDLSSGPVDEEASKIRTLVIPEGFTRNVLAGEQQQLRLEKEHGSNEQYGFAAQVHILRAIGRSLIRLVEMREGGLESSGPGDLETFQTLGARPPLVKLEVSSAGQGRPVPSGRAQSVPGILTMTVLMMTVIYGAVFLTVEKREGMLRRQISLPVSRAQIYLGKLAGRFAVASVQILVLLVIGRTLFGVSWGSSPVGLALVVISFAISVTGLSTLLGAVVSTPEQASAIGWLLSMLLAGLGGCWWPSEVMPPWLWSVAHALPTAWAMDAFHALISFGQGVGAVLVPSLVMLGFGVAFSLLGARFLRFE